MSEALATANTTASSHSNLRRARPCASCTAWKAESVERLVARRQRREIVRTPREVHAYLPDRRVVLVEPRTDGGSLLKALPTPGAELDAQYLLEVRSGSRLLGRDVA